MTELVYINGDLVPRDEAKISVFDHGFLYGYGLFETMRAYNGTIFLLGPHMERLKNGAAAIGLDLRGIDLIAACRETVQANHLTEARVRLTVTGGDAPSMPWDPTGGKPTIVVHVREFKGIAAEVYARGYRAGVSSVRRCADSALAGIKSNNYLVTVLARKEAAAMGLDESILFNDKGCIAEGGNSNVFFTRKGVLVTPTLESGILPGITRQLVMEIAAEHRISVSEEEIPPESLNDFDEGFMTSAVIEVMPLVEIVGIAGKEIMIGNGKPGAITRLLMAGYLERVKRDTGG